MIPVHDSQERVVLVLDHFEGATTEEGNNIKTMVFSYLYDHGRENEFSVKVDNVSFGDEEVSIVSSIDWGMELLDELTIYPNPTHGNCTLEFRGERGTYMIEVIDLGGRSVYMSEGGVSLGLQKIKLSTEDLSKGIYVVKLSKSDGKSFTAKLTIF